MARRRPENILPSLAEALDQAERAFPDDNNGMGRSLVLAFRNGEIATQGRFLDQSGRLLVTGVPVDVHQEIPAYFWNYVDPEQVQWADNRCTFLLPLHHDGTITPREATDIQVFLPHLLQWIGQDNAEHKASQKRKGKAGEQASASEPAVYGTRLRRAEASRYLKEAWGIERTENTLAKLAVVGGGPHFEHAGRIPLYPRDELDRWAKSIISSLKSSTSDTGRTGA